MRFIEAERPEKRQRSHKLCKWQKIIFDFVDSGLDCAKLIYEDEEEYPKSKYSDTLSVNRSAERLKVDVFARTVNKEIYLFKGKRK